MRTPSSLSVVIPVYNEIEAIPFVIDELAAALAQSDLSCLFAHTEVIVVDDGSDDGSAELLRHDPRVRLLQTGGRKGYGAALKLGFSESASDLIAFLDMDRTYDASDLLSLVREQIRMNADLVSGCRLKSANGMPFVRRIGNHFWLFV